MSHYSPGGPKKKQKIQQLQNDYNKHMQTKKTTTNERKNKQTKNKQAGWQQASPHQQRKARKQPSKQANTQGQSKKATRKATRASKTMAKLEIARGANEAENQTNQELIGSLRRNKQRWRLFFHGSFGKKQYLPESPTSNGQCLRART